jgi:hypothetical protein
MEDKKIAIARRHLELVQGGFSREEALSQLQQEGLISSDLTPEQRIQTLDDFASILWRYLEPRFGYLKKC